MKVNPAKATTATLGDLIILNPAQPRGLRGDEDVAFVPMAAVSEQGRMSAERMQVSDLKPGFSYFQRGDVLVAKITPCFENNKLALADFEETHGFGSTEFHVLRPNPEDLDGRYLVHFLRQDRIREAGERRMTGSAGQRRVPRQFFQELPIPRPPLDEQRRIAAVLDQADDLRRKRRAALDLLTRLYNWIFIELFGEPISNSMQWPVTTLEQIGSLDRGVSKHRPRNDPELLGGAYPLIQTGDVANCDRVVRNCSSFYSKKGLSQSKMWPRGTLCITIAANIGRTGVLDFDACFPDSVVGLVPFANATVEYIQGWFAFIQPTLERDAPQFAQKNINLAILRGLVIPVPPLDLQRAFAARVAEIDKLKAVQKGHLARLDTLFAALQHRAFRGEL